MTGGSLSALWDFYGDVFRMHSHQLLAWAHADVRSQLKPDMEEPEITGLLADAMKFRLSHHPDTPEEYNHYWPGDQEPLSHGGRLGNDRLRLDITIIRNGIRPRIAFIFEAKRLRTGGFPIGKYVGAGGMGDFIECRYGVECPEAAMVALFQNRDVAYWQGELTRVFREDSANKSPQLGIRVKLAPAVVLTALPGELSSVHQRTNGEKIRLFHVFLDCS